MTDEPLLTVDEDLHGAIEILYEGNPVKDISLLIIRLFNDGNEAIKSNDFEEPITISFSPNVGILSVEIIDVDPKTINAKIKSDNDKVVIEPLLLNKKDSITIKALLTGSKPECEIPSHTNLDAYGHAHLFDAENDLMLHARIVGITAIKEITKNIAITFFEYEFKISKAKLKDVLVFSIGFVASLLAITIKIIK